MEGGWKPEKVGGSEWSPFCRALYLPAAPPGPAEEREQKLRLTPVLVSHPGHEDLFSCCQRKNFKGAPYSFFAIHITAALVLFMTDGMTVSWPVCPETRAGGGKRKGSTRVSWGPNL